MAPRMPDLTIENVKLIFRNFKGEEGPYNPQGKRTFGAVIDDDKVVQQMIADEWNIKFTKARDDDDVVEAYIPVEASYKLRAPQVTMITTSGRRTDLSEDMVSVLDFADIVTTDIIISPYHYDFNGETGVKAYLQTMFVTVRPNALEEKYQGVGD